MPHDILLKLIDLIPTLIWIVIIIYLLVRYRREITELVGRTGKIKAFGVEAEFPQIRARLIDASLTYKKVWQNTVLTYTHTDQQDWSEGKLDAVIDKAENIRDLLDGARVLWVDDHPFSNATIYRVLNMYGVVIDTVAETEEALTVLKWASEAYEVVVTDMVRGEDNAAGLHLIAGMEAYSIKTPVIIFVWQLDRDKGTPAGATAITNDPISLIRHIMDAIEIQRRTAIRSADRQAKAADESQ